MKAIDLTQYLMPDGRPKSISIDIDDEVADKAERIQKTGLSISCELLQTGEVAFYISDDKEEEDLVCEIATNGPGDNSPKKVFCRMVTAFKIE